MHRNQEYTSIGESFKGAYLLNMMAGPGEIVFSKEVYQTVKSFVSGEPLLLRNHAKDWAIGKLPFAQYPIKKAYDAE